MNVTPSIAIVAGALLSVTAALLASTNAGSISEKLSADARQAIGDTGAQGISARFTSPRGFATRHPLLIDEGDNEDTIRDRVAKAVAAVPGVGGLSWRDGTIIAQGAQQALSPLHCQEDVEALLRARTIRFEESSAELQVGSRELIGEVARALEPCLGSIILITGHTDNSGDTTANIRLSQERARAVRAALRQRGIPADGLRTRGVGSSEPVEGLEPGDPANRRIEFSVVRVEPLKPTPVDTPGPR